MGTLSEHLGGTLRRHSMATRGSIAYFIEGLDTFHVFLSTTEYNVSHIYCAYKDTNYS